MFWIVGAESIVMALREISDKGFIKLLADQLEHKDWAGFACYDLIFPLFVFIVGVSLVFSLSKVSQGGRVAAFRRVVTRSLMLYALGILYSGGFSRELHDIRLLGVLQRIALCYCFASLLFLTFRLRGLVIACVTLLVGYWALMTFVPVPGLGAGHFEKGANLANYIDSRYLPWRKYDGKWDPEGILSTLPAIASCLLGVFAGMLLRNRSIGDQKKVLCLMAAGVAGVTLGFLWGMQFPVVKKIWTSSFVLVAGGYSCLLLGLFYLVVDVWKFQLWARPFVWIGVNPITIYLLCSVLSFEGIAKRLVGGPIKGQFGVYGDLLVASVALGLVLLFARFMYQRKIFLRV